MLRKNKLPQKGRTHNKSLMLISFLVVAFMLIPNVAALEFDNVHSYDEQTKIATITNAFGLGDVIGQAKLTTPLNLKVPRGYQKVAQFDIWPFQDYSDALKQFSFTDMKNKEKINREYDLKMLSYEDVEVEDYYRSCVDAIYINGTEYQDCERIKKGSHIEQKEVWTKVTPADLKKNKMLTIGVFTDVQKGDYIDWIPMIYGVEIPEWATWEESLNVDIYSYWAFEDGSGSSVTDAVNSKDLTANAVDANDWLSDGCLIGGCLKFDDTGEALTRDNADLTNLLNELDTMDNSLCLWANLTNVVSLNYLAGISDSDNAPRAYRLYSTSGNLEYRMQDDSGGDSVSNTDPNTNSGQWHHYCMTWDTDTSNATIYVDGVYLNSDTGASGTFSQFSYPSEKFTLGGNYKNSAFLGTMTGVLDEIGLWNRTLTSSEVSDLYNEGTGITYSAGSPATAPSVTLTSPSDGENLTSATVEHIATVTDAVYVENVTLYLDGVANETKTTHINGSYTFTKVVSEGVHTWSILAWNNNSLSNQSANWTYNYTMPPLAIDLLSPSDASTHETPTVNVSCESYDPAGVIELNLTINGVVNKTITNSTPGENLTIQGNINFSEGNYTWGCSSYNSLASATSSNRTFEVLYSSPDVSLTLPIAYANLTTQNINFTSNVTDVNGISNVTLYIDGVLNETNTSGVNGSYSFNKIITDGTHNWSIVSESIYGKSTTSATRVFSIDASAPIINITAPPSVFDYLINGETLNLNWTVSDLNLDSCWYIYYTSEMVFTNPTGDSSELLDGIYSYVFIDNGSQMNLFEDIDNITLVTGNTGSPASANYTINTTNCASVGGVKTLVFESNSAVGNNWEAITCDVGTLYNLSIGDFGDLIGFQELVIPPTPINCSLNTTTFSYISGYNNITFLANDTLGNIASETRNWTSLIGTLGIAYESPVYEGYSNDITASIELEEGSSLTAATLYYNGTNYSTSINYDSNVYNVTTTLSAPSVTTDTNYTFGFYLTIDGTVYDPQENNQTVLNANFGECGGVSNDTILTLNLVNEETQSSITGDIEVAGDIKSVSSGESIGTIYTNFTAVSNASLCFSPPSAYDLYYMDAEIRYTSNGYSSELYYLQNADITDDLGNLTLYDLNETDATTFKITYQDSFYNFVEGAILQLQRKYISEGVYKTVEAPLTSYEGVSVLHIDLDSILYRATVIKDGVVLDEFDNIVFQCQSELTGECEHKLLGEINPGNEQDLDNTRDFYYSEPVLSNDSITVSFSVPSGTPSSVNIVLEQKDQFANKTLCNRTITSSAGSMSCEYSETLGESYIDFIIYKDSVPIAKKSYFIHERDYLDWLGNNYIFIFVLLLSLVGMALTSPEWIIINGILTMVLAGGLYLARGLDFVVGLGSIVWLVIAAIILISKMAKQEDR